MAIITHGVVRGLGNQYADGTERMEIHVLVMGAQGLPHRNGERTPVVLRIGRRHYQGGLRATENNPYVWICPDVVAPDGTEVRLAHLLTDEGLGSNDRVFLVVDGSNIAVVPARWD
ncbi:hypothetical protein SAMN05421829_101132 [Aromatoleum tolulyticum]|uniref:Uncharacterized protein n=1 Tax=Aromatoleum tolulyticum TaxID=34027 RepID=A0A1N6N746_9RHOO|nr:hypothetical protein [Aromatoleum tolulyticum]SIP87827.1 hypothetical protein SAMN05421829_101132 [Aromatoleum tolulyticum]